MDYINNMGKLQIINGQIFGKLTIINEVDKLVLPSGQFNRAFLCKCNCGKETIVRLLHLSRGRTISCGCIQSTRNNEYHTPVYSAYRAMMNRVKENYTEKQFYFDKGITVCDEWKNDFEVYKKWAVLNGFKKGLQIDRIDNSKGYCPENCRFVTCKVNVNNRDCTVIVTYHGEKLPFTSVMDKLGLDLSTRTVRSRIDRGWSHDDAFDTPIKKGNYFIGKRN